MKESDSTSSHVNMINYITLYTRNQAFTLLEAELTAKSNSSLSSLIYSAPIALNLFALCFLNNHYVTLSMTDYVGCS